MLRDRSSKKNLINKSEVGRIISIQKWLIARGVRAAAVGPALTRGLRSKLITDRDAAR